jgi:hypothetical protein
MIYCREQGETFGLSIAEFSAKNKPIILYADSPERNHINMLRDKGFYYRNYDEVYNTIKNFNILKNNHSNYDVYSNFYSPENVMAAFDHLLINTL